MDIMHLTSSALPHKEVFSAGQAAIDDCDKVLNDFKNLSNEVKDDVTKLHEAANDLVREVLFNVEQGQAKVNSAEWSGPQFTNCKQNVANKQKSAWETLEAEALALKAKLEVPYKFLLASKENITKARGDNGLFGTGTDDQKEVRRVYDHKLKRGFDDAAATYAAVSSYPDGMTTQIPLLKKRAMAHLGL